MVAIPKESRSILPPHGDPVRVVPLQRSREGEHIWLLRHLLYVIHQVS